MYPHNPVSKSHDVGIHVTMGISAKIHHLSKQYPGRDCHNNCSNQWSLFPAE
jgi:hypothetical protein